MSLMLNNLVTKQKKPAWDQYSEGLNEEQQQWFEIRMGSTTWSRPLKLCLSYDWIQVGIAIKESS